MNDKMLHMIAGLIISLFFGYFYSVLVGFMMSAIVGGAKEIIWDMLLQKGTPDIQDFIATLQGGLIGCIILLGVQFFGGG